MKARNKSSVNVRKPLLVLGLLNIFLLSSVLSFAQKTNLSGNWTLNAAKSSLGEGGEGGRGPRAAAKIKIIQDENSIVLEKTSSRPSGEEFTSKETITLDGKECENTLFGNRTRKSTATWTDDGKALSINSVSVFERDGNRMERKSVEVFKLSDDGNTLTIESTSSSQEGERKRTLSYDKAQ